MIQTMGSGPSHSVERYFEDEIVLVTIPPSSCQASAQ